MAEDRREELPWYRQRWRLELLLPMLLFGAIAVTSLARVASTPLASLVIGGPSLLLTAVFARLLWRDRHSRRSDVRWPTGRRG